MLALWAKLARDAFAFVGNPWFPTRAAVALGVFGVLVALLDLALLLRPADARPTRRFSRFRKALVLAAFLGSLYGCWADETVFKALDIYVVIPAFVLIVVLAPEGRAPGAVRLLLLGLAVFLLLPNDLCWNPQNAWWVRKVGASPMTYAAPVNVYIVLATAAGDRPVVRAACLVVTALVYAASVFHRLVPGGY